MNRPEIMRWSAIFCIACNGLLSVAVLIILCLAPYTGMRISGENHPGRVIAIDDGSPARVAGIRQGDIITGCNGRALPATAFVEFPDYPVSRQETAAYWQERKKLAGEAAKGAVTLQVEREGKPLTVTVALGRFPLGRIAALVGSFFLVAWTFQGLSLLVIRKRSSAATHVNLLASALLCTMLLVDALFAPCELFFPWLPFRYLYVLNYLSALIFPFATLHMMLLFPDPVAFLDRHPLAIRALYAVASVIVLLEVAGVFDNTLLTASYPQVICLLAAFLLLGVRYAREKNMLRRKQLQWAFFGFGAGLGWGIFLFTPYAQRLSGALVYSELTILPIMITPVCLTIAIVRYRLMGISRLVDATFTFLATMLLLSAVEFLFIWGVFAGQLPETGINHSIAFIKTLLVVLLFIPVRNFIRKMLDRVFKRGNYDSAEELKNFMVRLSVQDGGTAIEKFSAFAEDLLGTSGCCVIKYLPPSHVLYADSNEAHRMGALICAREGGFWQALRQSKRASYGLAHDDIVSADEPELQKCAEECLFVPFMVDGAVRYCGVLLKKSTRALYTAKDVELADGLSLSLGKVLEAEELRLAHEAAEAEFHRQKEGVIQEMHDVLGNIITSIAVTAQAAGRFHGDPARVLELLGKIGTFSNQATDFLRTGLTVLDNLDAGLGELFHAMKRRFADVMETVGVTLVMEVSPDVHALKFPPEVTIHLLRCTQEAVSNIIKHSDACNASITLATDGQTITLEIADDGNGFSDGEISGYGLRNIAGRVDALNGTMRFENARPSGMVLTISIPAPSPLPA